MRRLMWFTIGFAAACAGFAYLVSEKPYIPAIICLICTVVLFFLKTKPCRLAALILLGAGVGFLWSWGYQQLYLGDPQKLDGTCQTVTITATDYSYETTSGCAVDAKLRYGGKDYKVKLYLYDELSLSPGDRYCGECTFRYTALGAASDPTYHQGKGIYLLAYSSEEYTITPASEEKLSDFPAKIRRTVGQRIDSLFSDDVAGFAKALLLGDTSDISYETSTTFSVSGISHIIAVSGLHVSILFTVIAMLCFRQRHLTALIGIPVLLVFAAVAGFTPSVVRACLMQVLLMLSAVWNTEYDPPTALAFSALIILCLNPLTITAVGFQLSVACMIGIYAFSGRIHKYLLSRKWAAGAAGKGIRHRLLRMVLSSVSVSFSVWIVTTPLCAIHFGMVSVVGILTNLLTVWVVSFIFYGIMLACLASVVWMPLGFAISWLTTWPMRFVQTVASLLSVTPYSAVYTCSMRICLWLVFCYVLLGLFVLLRFKRPGLLISCILAGLVIACTWDVLAERDVKTRISILDVGQGQCVLLKHNGGYYLVDCGGSSDFEAADTAAEYLLSKGIRKLDGLILTNYKNDHVGGVKELLTRIEVDILYLPDIEPSDSDRLELEQKYADRIQWVYDSFALSSVPITMYCTEDNISVLFQPDNYDILIQSERTSSGELELMRKADITKLELLVLGHHGSAGSTGFDLLRRTQPQAVVISVGDNYFGHPKPEVLERLALFDSCVYRTDRDGTLEFGR